jgi:hypothetical protein
MTIVVSMFSVFAIIYFVFVVYMINMMYKNEEFYETTKFEYFIKGISYSFEFTFGAVDFHKGLNPRPAEYLMNVCLLFISFFGNIMFANLLIAFLSN